MTRKRRRFSKHAPCLACSTRQRAPTFDRSIRLESVFAVSRLDRAGPWAVELGEHFFRGRDPGINDTVQWFQIARLVTSEMIGAATTAQSRMRQHQTFLGDFEDVAILDPGLEAEMRNVVPQRLSFR